MHSQEKLTNEGHQTGPDDCDVLQCDITFLQNTNLENLKLWKLRHWEKTFLWGNHKNDWTTERLDDGVARWGFYERTTVREEVSCVLLVTKSSDRSGSQRRKLQQKMKTQGHESFKSAFA